jgi:hypothetical protein
LCRGHYNLVCDRFAANRIDDLVVDEFNGSVCGDVEIKVGRVGDVVGTDFISNTEGIEFRMRFSWDSLFILDCRISVTIDGGIDSKREDVLMRWSHDTRPNHDSIGEVVFDALFHGNNGHDACCTSLKMDSSSGIENPAEDIFVVGNGHDRLDDEFTSSCDFGTSVAEVGVFPTDTGIDFVHANGILHFDWFTLLVVDPSVKVLDDPETVAAQSEIVGSCAGAAFTEIISGFSMVWRSWVTVGNSHLSESEAIEDGSSIVTDVSKNGPFTVIESQSELPLLPRDDLGILMSDGEADALWLRDVKRLEVLTERRLHLGGIFLIWLGDVDVIIGGAGEEIAGEGKSLDANDFLTYSVDNAGEVKRMCVVIERRMFLLGINRSKEKVALPLD